MVDKIEDSEMFWENYLRKNCMGDLEYIIANYPKRTHIIVDISKIHNNPVWDSVLKHPDILKKDIIKVIKRCHSQGKLKENSKIDVRFINVPQKRKIRELRHDDEGKLISISCLVKRATPVKPEIVKSTFRCNHDHPTVVEMEPGGLISPTYCSTQSCTSKKLKHIEKEDQKQDAQNLYVQDILEDLEGGTQPESMRCKITGTLTNEENQVIVGDRIVINGIMRSYSKIKEGKLQPEKLTFIEVNNIERSQSAYEDIVITAEEEKEIERLSLDDNVFEILSSSIAPQIVNRKMMKRAVLLQLFEGVSRNDDNGIRTRGQINVLLASDPGMAKTKVLEYALLIAPRGAMASGPSASKVGLVASISKDEILGTWSLDAGSFMLANNGLLCLDEGDKLGAGGWSMISQAMESGIVNIDKASVHVTVQTQASLLVACNAKGGKNFDMFSADGIISQVDIPDYIMSRFDLKVMMTDNSSESETRDVVAAMLAARRKGKVERQGHLEPAFIRKYIAHARKINPELPEVFEGIIADYIIKMKKEMGGSPKTMKITPRQTTSIVLLAEAHARMRLRDIVEEKDVVAAIELFDMCFRDVNTNQQTGLLDMGLSTVSKTRAGISYMILKTIRDIGGDTNKASEMSVTNELKKKGYEVDKIEGTIRLLKGEGKLMEPQSGLLQVI